MIRVLDAADLAILLGFLLVAIGCYLAWPPLAFIVPGALILWMLVLRPGGKS